MTCWPRQVSRARAMAVPLAPGSGRLRLTRSATASVVHRGRCSTAAKCSNHRDHRRRLPMPLDGPRATYTLCRELCSTGHRLGSTHGSGEASESWVFHRSVIRSAETRGSTGAARVLPSAFQAFGRRFESCPGRHRPLSRSSVRLEESGGDSPGQVAGVMIV